MHGSRYIRLYLSFHSYSQFLVRVLEGPVVSYKFYWKRSYQAFQRKQGCHQVREFVENQGIIFSIRENQKEMKDFLKSHGKWCFEKSGKIKEVVELLLFHFRVVNFSIFSRTSSWVWQFPSFPLYSISFCAVILKSAVILKCSRFEVQSFWSAVILKCSSSF